jgi:hypothetical protein
MADHTADAVPVGEALAILADTFANFPLEGRAWLEVLEGSDLLRRDTAPREGPVDDWSNPSEVVRFAFQRLQDNLIARSLLARCNDVERAFADGAMLSFLIQRIPERGKNVVHIHQQWAGVVSAIWSALAEVHGKELVDLASFFNDDGRLLKTHQFKRVFRESVRDRRQNAITQRTRQILNDLFDASPEEKIEVLLSAACVPSHPWNARALHERLRALSIEDRTNFWVRPLSAIRTSELRDTVSNLIDWTLHADLGVASPEVVELAIISLAWLSVDSSIDGYHDVKRALEVVSHAYPSIVESTRTLFMAFDQDALNVPETGSNVDPSSGHELSGSRDDERVEQSGEREEQE